VVPVHVAKTIDLFPRYRQMQLISYIINMASNRAKPFMIPGQRRWAYTLTGASRRSKKDEKKE
jgi:hypothetical protein